MSGIPDGACPECGGAFRYSTLLTEARAAAAAKAARQLPTVTAADVKKTASWMLWAAIFGAPMYFLCIGVLSIVFASAELGKGHYWSDTPSWFPWPQSTPVPTVQSALAGGRLAVGVGCILAIGAASLWRIFRPSVQAGRANRSRPSTATDRPDTREHSQ